MIAEKTELVERMLSAAIAQTEELTDLLAQDEKKGDPAFGRFDALGFRLGRLLIPAASSAAGEKPTPH